MTSEGAGDPVDPVPQVADPGSSRVTRGRLRLHHRTGAARRSLSLKTRLLAAVSIVALGALVASDIATYSALRSSLFGQADQSLDAVHGPLEDELNSGRVISVQTVARLAPGMFVEVLNPAGQAIASVPAVLQGGQQVSPDLTPDQLQLPSTSSATTLPATAMVPGGSGGPGGPPSPFAPGAPLPDRVARYLTVSSGQSGGPLFRVRVSPLIGGYELVLATPLTSTSGTLHRLFLIEMAVTLGALVAAVAFGLATVRLGLRPLSDIQKTVEAIAAGDLSHRVPESQPHTEVGRLARAFNTMIDRIQDAFSQRDATETELRRSEERMRRFVADASHELRTPLAAVSAYAELFERGAQDHPDDLARVLAGIRTESSRMGLLVEDLMLLARLDEGRPLVRRPVELVPLCAAAVEAARTVGPRWPVRLFAAEPVESVGDPERLRQVLDNLLANVRAHTPEGTEARVTVRQEGDAAVIEVVDNGPGLSAEAAERAFERFYRADNARTRAPAEQVGAAGSGLGLSIVAAIVHALGGSVDARAVPGGGAAFALRLPLRSRSHDSVESGETHPATARL